MEQPNNDYIDQLAGDDAAFRARMIGILQSELPQEIQTFQNQIQNCNFAQAAQSVHKLKHKISILGLEKGYYLAEEFEAQLKDNDAGLQGQFDAILAQMQRFVQNL